MGRIVSAIIFLSALSAILAGGLCAATVSVRIDVDASSVRIIESGKGGSIVSADGMTGTNYYEFPSLPFRSLSVLIPMGEDVVSFGLVDIRTVELSGSVELDAFEGMLLDDGTVRGVGLGIDEATGDGSVFPAWKVRHTGTSQWKGYTIATFEVYPVSYDLDSGRLTVDEDLTLVVETAPVEGEKVVATRQRHIDGFRESAEREVRKLVENPADIGSYIFEEIIVDEGDRGFLPAYQPGLEGSAVNYLIVTDSAMEAEFQRLADWKTLKGVPTVVRTIEWIEQNYWSGADLAESVRNFIREAYEKWGVEYVLLGGDTDVIPARFGYTTFYTGDQIPTDMYFSCLDGTWNADGDSLWGEAFHSLDDPGDDADLFSEVYVGRLPASDVTEATILIDKVMTYEAPGDTAYKEDFLFLGEVIFPSDFTPGDDIVLDGAEILESIYTVYFAGNPSTNSTRLYENYTVYAGSTELTTTSTLDAMNLGSNHVMHSGHGYKYNMSVGNGSIINYDAYGLTNGDETFSMYLMNCTNVAFDTDCLAEYFLLNPNGGAFAVTGSSRSAFPSASRPYMDEYYELLFTEDVVQLGKLYTKSREPFTNRAGGETADRWTHFIYNFLGDPETNMFRGEAGTFVVTVPDSLPYGSNSVTIEVTSGGLPPDSAYVCLYKYNDDYAHGYTDAAGQITFDDFLVRDSGAVTVTVTGVDHCRATAVIPVNPEAGEYLRANKTLIDDTAGGNGDGILDSGETVNLTIELFSTGQTDAEKLWAEVTPLHPDVSMIEGVSLYPDIPVGDAQDNIDLFEFTVDPIVPDETSLEFLLEIHDSTGGYWAEQFAMETHAPRLELFLNTVTDSIPVGNEDGVIDDGEDFLLRVGLKNYGTGAAVGLEGKIRAEDSGITVTDSVSNYMDLGILGLGYGDGFILSEASVGVENYFTFEAVDLYGRTFTKRMELRPPGTPHSVVLDASLGEDQIHVTWRRPDTLEAYKHMVYHSMDQGGPYDAATSDPVLHTLYRDRNLMPSTRYYYVITMVDSCGNSSVPSSEVTVTTNPPQQTGWPNHLGKESASSPKIADVDGDTHADVVVGAEYVYAWDGNGVELRDGDGHPLTWGIFNTEGDNFTATVALGELDGVIGAEIVGASWNTREIYVFTHDGSILPGWPKSTRDLCWASPVIGDFDGDGDREVIAYDIDGTVYVWHHDGTELMDGDDNPATDGPFFAAGLPAQGWHVSTPALADMDNDGIVEIIVAAPSDSIYALNSDQSAVAGWPVYIGDAGATVGASPVVGDIDGDTFPEVIIQNSAWRVQGLNHDGTDMPGWPIGINCNSFFAGSAALADFTGDGRLEVVIPGMDTYCYFYRYDGTPMPGWPKQYASSGVTETSPVIADINGDNSLDIVLGSEEGRLNAWDINGDIIPGFPIMLSSFIRGTPVVKDLDFDGDVELIASCWNQNVYVWDLDARYYPGYAQWNGFHGDQFNSGWKELDVATDAAVTAWMYELGPDYLRLTWSLSRETEEWDLYRQTGDGEYELVAMGLTVEAGGTLSFTDRMVEEGLVYRYLLEVAGGGVSVETESIEVPVASARLYQNHPNPFNPSTTIAFTVPGSSGSRQNVALNVYDIRGALVRSLVNGPVAGGRHEVSWNGTNNRGEQVASGVYFTRFASGGYRSVRKMILLR
jgi:hypothetical protein